MSVEENTLRNSLTLAATLLLTCLATASCSQKPSPEPLDTLSPNVEAFHSGYNSGEFDAIYKAASPLYKEKTALSNHRRVLQKNFDRCGRVVTSTLLSHLDKRYPDGFLVAGSYNSTFERCSLTEYFGFRHYSSNGQSLLMTYSTEDN